MSDEILLELERAWRARPTDDALARLLTAHVRIGRDPSWELLAVSPRWRRHVGFVRKWFSRPLEASDGMALGVLDRVERELAVRLPRTLREAYRLLGNRDDVLGGTSAPLTRLIRPEELRLEGGLLVFNYGEQDEGPRVIGVDTADADPEVSLWPDGCPDDSHAAGSFSEFLLAQLVFQRVYCRPDSLFTQSAVDVTRYARLPLPTWRHFADEVRLYGDANTIIAIEDGGRGGAYAATRDAEARTRLLSAAAWAES